MDYEALKKLFEKWNKNIDIYTLKSLIKEFVTLGGSEFIDKVSYDLDKIVNHKKPINFVNVFSEDAFFILKETYEIATYSVRAGIQDDSYELLLELSNKLALKGILIVESLEFLKEIFYVYTMTSREAKHEIAAFNSLLNCIKQRKGEIQDAQLEINEDLSYRACLFLTLDTNLMTKEQFNFLCSVIENIRSFYPDLFDKYPIFYKTLKQHKIAESIKNIPIKFKDKFNTNRVISVHSHKGGVGKSFLSLALATRLAQEGSKVCIVDADTIGPSIHFYSNVSPTSQNPENFFTTIFIKMERIKHDHIPCQKINFSDQSLNDKTQLFMIPGSLNPMELSKFDSYQRGRRPPNGIYIRNVTILNEMLSILINDFDYIIVDTSPGLQDLPLEILWLINQLSQVSIFVVRPRIVDIAGFLLESATLDHADMNMDKTAIVFNAIDDKHKKIVEETPLLIDYISNTLFYANQMKAYIDVPDPDERNNIIRSMVKNAMAKFTTSSFSIPFIKELREISEFLDIRDFEEYCEEPTPENQIRFPTDQPIRFPTDQIVASTDILLTAERLLKKFDIPISGEE